nr:MAG TPA: hypothetical protein [Caudoviricetes sp.]
MLCVRFFGVLPVFFFFTRQCAEISASAAAPARRPLPAAAQFRAVSTPSIPFPS